MTFWLPPYQLRWHKYLNDIYLTNQNNRLSTYMLFTEREVRIGKNCARGLEYGPRPQAEDHTQDRGHSFSQYGPT